MQNHFERRYYSAFDPLSVSRASSDDSVSFTVNLIANQTMSPNPSGAGSTTVMYPDAFDSDIFSVNGAGNMVIKKTGLYNVETTTVCDSNLFASGTRGHYIKIDGLESYKHGYTNQTTNADTPDNSATLFSSFSIKLNAGQTLTHQFRHNSTADLFLIGSGGSANYFTNVKILLVIPAPV